MSSVPAVNAGVDSRTTAGLRAPRKVSKDFTPARGGSAVHWGAAAGPKPSAPHSACRKAWAGYQSLHMGARGWDDIAYTAGFCQHGIVLMGRGWGVRTAANGTTDGNNRYYAFCWIGGPGQQPTVAARQALAWLVHEARQRGAGRQVVAHSGIVPTACPGDELRELVRRINTAGVRVPAAKVKKKPAAKVPDGATLRRGSRGSAVSWLQRFLGVKADGVFGSRTHAAVLEFQRRQKVTADGIVGPRTWAKIRARVDA